MSLVRLWRISWSRLSWIFTSALKGSVVREEGGGAISAFPIRRSKNPLCTYAIAFELKFGGWVAGTKWTRAIARLGELKP